MTEIVALESHSLSDDGRLLTLTMASRVGAPVNISIPTDYVDGLIKTLRAAQQAAQAKRTSSERPEIAFRRLKNWAVGSHAEEAAVLLVLDPQTELENSYAMGADAADKMAAALAEKSQKIKSRTNPKLN